MPEYNELQLLDDDFDIAIDSYASRTNYDASWEDANADD